jgi:hypothetical protein
MAFNILNLFRSSGGAAADGLTQPQREAIADLLHYCMYADNTLGLAEAAAFEKEVGKLDWESTESFESFAARSVTRARRASETPDADEGFLSDVAACLDSAKARRRAVKMCTAVFAADGTADRERGLLERIRNALGKAGS